MSIPDNIYLTGMMGCGKSTLGELLAEQLGYTFFDMDSEIESETKQSINEIFSTKGEEYFRNKESTILKTLSQKKHQVVATGGGIILRSNNCKLMRDSGKVIYLNVKLEILTNRLKGDKSRPLLKSTTSPEDTLRSLLDQRSAKYEQCSHFVIESYANIEQTLSLIIDELSK